MTARFAGIYGGVAGFLVGVAIALVYNVPMTDAFYRLLALTICGAWMGAMLIWLDQLLPHEDEQESSKAER